MKNLLLIGAVVLAGYWFVSTNPELVKSFTGGGASGGDAVQQAYDDKQTNIQVTGEGVVSSIHPLVRDDGERVQKFIVLLPTGLKLLVIHDFEASSLISNLKTGDSVEFSGVYTWNSSGGIVSGTHQDPAGLRWPGWIKHRGKTYQ